MTSPSQRPRRAVPPRPRAGFQMPEVHEILPGRAADRAARVPEVRVARPPARGPRSAI